MGRPFAGREYAEQDADSGSELPATSSKRAPESGEASEGDDVARQWGSTSQRRAMKKPRMAWTPELHARFLNAVNHLGVKNAVPKTILQLMNVEGMTRENVASHLQKYRMYLKRIAANAAAEQADAAAQPFAQQSMQSMEVKPEPLSAGSGMQYAPACAGRNFV
ncbi:hypothetical protein WJX72_008403 [[Myrmecia] bisecta]|uniref:HTH myb-type domain-containing protein n=1 Tax=[Myrmecia] bisecta TaxID=41462 RepID=A0AAW1QRQ9_9CHLO